MIRHEITGYDGKKISLVEWPVDNPKGIVLISHGMCEHALRYEFIAERLNMAGYLVLCDDHRGHGQTDKDTLGYCDGNMYDDTLKDMALILKIYGEKYPGIKRVLFSHSYGSFLAQRFLQEYNEYVDGVILGGSADMGGAMLYAGGLVAWIGCTFKGKSKPAEFLKKITFDSYNNKLKGGNFISTIPEEVKRYQDDPYCGFVCSYGFYKYFFKGLRAVYKGKNMKKLNADLPIMIISGDSDPVGGFSKLTTKLYKRYLGYGVKDVKLKLYNNVYHEYLNDISREEAAQDIVDFVNRICA